MGDEIVLDDALDLAALGVAEVLRARGRGGDDGKAESGGGRTEQEAHRGFLVGQLWRVAPGGGL